MSGGKYVEMGWIKISDSGEKPSLVGSRCLQCSEVFFPPKKVCPNCWSRNFEKIFLGQKGLLDNFSISFVAPQGFKAPYVQGFVDLQEGPRIFSLIEVDESEYCHLKKGCEVELTIKEIFTDDSKSPTAVWKYVPIRNIKTFC